MAEQFDDWGTSDGIEYDGKIVDAYFAHDPKYMNGEVPLLHLQIEVEGASEDRVEKLAFGTQFEIDPDSDGRRIREINPGRRPKKVNARSKYGRFFTSALRIPELEKHLRTFEGGYRNADCWIGLTLAFGTEVEHLKFDDGERDVSYLVVDDLIAIDGVETAGGASSAGAATNDDKILAALTSLAKEVEDPAEFVVRAVAEVPGVEESEEWSSKCLDPAFHAELRG